MRQPSILGTCLLVAFPLLLLAAPVAGADLFWVGGTNDWNNRFAWSSISGSAGGAGPPTGNDVARFENLGSTFMATFNGNGVAHQVIISGSGGTMDLNGNKLTLARRFIGRPPNTFRADSNFAVNASTGKTSELTLTDGEASSNSIWVNPAGTASITIAPDFTFNITASDSVLPLTNVFVLGPGAEIIVQGQLFTDEAFDNSEPSVRIDDGGRLTIDDGFFNHQGSLHIGTDGPFGSLVVSDGQAFVEDDFIIGASARASFDVDSSGIVETRGPVIIGRDSGVTGIVRVRDPNSNWFFRGHLITKSKENLVLGDAGNGFLAVVDGANAESDLSNDVILGRKSGSNGELEVSSGGTFRTDGSVYIGGDQAAAGGTGTVRVRSGGVQPPGHLDIGGTIKLWNDGTLNVFNGIVDAGTIEMPTTSGTLILDGGGIINATDVTLAVTAGNVQLNHGEIDVTAGTLETGSNFIFGQNADPVTVRLLDGARSDVSNWTIGSASGGVGVTEVAGVGSGVGGLFANIDVFVGGVDVDANGTLNVTDGGKVRANDDISIGRGKGSSGTVQVQGIGAGGRRSLLQSTATLAPNDGEIEVGRGGTGVLNVRDGGLAQAFNNVSVASMPGSKGTVSVGGKALTSPATLRASNELAVGGFALTGKAGGAGSIDVLADGLVSVGDRTTVYDDGSVGVRGQGTFEASELLIDGGSFRVLGAAGSAPGLATIDGVTTVTGTGAQLRLEGGTFRTGTLDLGGVLSRLNWQAGTLGLTASEMVIGDGGLLSTNVTLNADQTLEVKGSVFIGGRGGAQLTLNGGMLIGQDEILIENGNTLAGNGTIQTPVFLENDGTVRPGLSAGELTVVGNYAQTSAGELFIELGGTQPGEFDVLSIEGAADLDGLLEISLANDFVPQVGDHFEFLTASSVIGTFSSVHFPAEPPLPWVVQYGPTAVRLIVAEIPPGDCDQDGDVDLADFLVLQQCVTGPAPAAIDTTCLCSDLDGDGTIDLADVVAFQAAFTGSQ